jgi:DNA polymerase I-like protein with 3'-5' exonuclease and polymerase domains
MNKALETLKQAFDKTDLPNHCEDIENALHYYDGESSAEDFIQHYLETYIHSAEIIYYHNAINYLKDNDPSLMESMAKAAEYGYDVQSLNSELLASLLLQDSLTEILYNLESDLTEYFEAVTE